MIVFCALKNLLSNYKVSSDNCRAKIIFARKLRNPYFCRIFGMARPFFCVKMGMYQPGLRF